MYVVVFAWSGCVGFPGSVCDLVVLVCGGGGFVGVLSPFFGMKSPFSFTKKTEPSKQLTEAGH